MSDTRVLYKPYIVGGASTSFVVSTAVVGPTFPDAVTGLVGGGASYTGWWGIRAYSQAKATALANALELRSVNTNGNATIHLTAAGVLNTAEIATLDASLGLVVNVIYDQVGSVNWLATGANATRPLFHQDHYGTNKHALEWQTNLNFDIIGTFPNTANNYIWTSYLKFVTGQTDSIIWGSNSAANFRCGMDATNIHLSQDSAFSTVNWAAAPGVDIPAAVLWHFNGTAGSVANKAGTDHPYGTTVGTVGITDNQVGLGLFTGGTGWDKGYWSEGGYMTDVATAANSIDATKRSAITTEMNNFYL